jgi:hypothetical protein
MQNHVAGAQNLAATSAAFKAAAQTEPSDEGNTWLSKTSQV